VINAEGPVDAPPRVDLAHLPADDPIVYRMLQEADTVGLFQVESRAQMATLPRLKPKTFYDLVVEVALIRPGPIVGQMVHPYLRRRKGEEAVTYAHPSLEPILKRTLGVPLFQEQLLRMAMAVAGFTGGEAEELRRAMGFKRSEARMRAIEQRLRAGMARNGITGETADAIVLSISSFALYGFPESHAASFALLVYASAYLKAYYPAAFYAALLNNQPLGFYHPATLIKDAQRHGVRFRPVDVQTSCWNCTIEPDGAVRLGLRMVQGLREDIGRKMENRRSQVSSPSPGKVGPASMGKVGPASPRRGNAPPDQCPKCGTDDASMIEVEAAGGQWRAYCNVCAHDWAGSMDTSVRAEVDATAVAASGPRFKSVDDLVAATGLRRDELNRLASLGALNSLGYDRRTALWDAERAARPSGDLFAGLEREAIAPAPSRTPLAPMTPVERLTADYDGSGVTIGPHPMALHRRDLVLRGVLRSDQLPQARTGRRVRVAGAVITRQRPGTAKGMVFLTLEDEVGLTNIIIRPDVFDRQRGLIVESPFLLVEGVLQQQDGVTSVRAERVAGLRGDQPSVPSHDFR
jgi:error-prone DNA polymerase